jgi:hypothetical protein
MGVPPGNFRCTYSSLLGVMCQVSTAAQQRNFQSYWGFELPAT